MCKCHGVVKIVFGLLLLLNAFLWPKWLGVDGWVSWVAVLIVLMGLVKLLVPACHCESGCCEAPKKKK
ncbi:MAG: hypothetical protein WCV90_07680 [Candidatus Woesearchaeota archaeon]|jgi:hypothetical protein